MNSFICTACGNQIHDGIFHQCHATYPKKTPHVCPICRGNGLVQVGFYNQTSGAWTTSGMQTEPCRSCQGSGVLWHE